MNLYDCQIDAVERMKNGCILDGDVGSGKSRTALVYYHTKVCNGQLKINGKGRFGKMRTPRDLYIITTAKKRDSLEWNDELCDILLEAGPANKDQQVNVVVDSWNNIKKYKNVFGAFFIFDEQRVVGKGAWVKAFLNIARKNQWILLSATPGDSWNDYVPVFIANGFYRNRSEFEKRHCIYSRFSKYPKIERYVDQGILVKHRNDILVHMVFERETVSHHMDILCDYNQRLYKQIWRDRWDPYDNDPITETGKLFYLMRKVVNSDDSRVEAVSKILAEKRRAIIFYNYTYELENLRRICKTLDICVGEWNGQLHTNVPRTERWAYLVQYSAGSEGWNCTTTDTVIFYSQSYSYRMTKQAEGRTDRANTPYKDLYYYHLKSKAPIDIAIGRALSAKRNFNESAFMKRHT